MNIPWYRLQRLHVEGVRQKMLDMRVEYSKNQDFNILDIRDQILTLSEALKSILSYIEQKEK